MNRRTTSRKRVGYSRYDFRRVDPTMTPTFNHPPFFSDVVTGVSHRSDAYRRRKVPPLMATPYLRYEFEYDPGVADVLLSPPFWTFWTRTTGVIDNAPAETQLLASKQYTNDVFYGPLTPVAPYNSISVVQNDLLSQIKSQSLNLAVSVAEGKQTLSFLANSTQRLALAAESLRKRDYAAFRRTMLDQGTVQPPILLRKGVDGALRRDKVRRPNFNKPRDRLPESDDQFRTRTASENWLMYRYAVMPIIYDVYGSAAYIAEMMHKIPPPVYRAGAQFTDNVESTFTSGSSAQEVNIRWTAVNKVTYKSALFYRVDEGALREAARLGITNPANVLWEKTTFSFLIDWLIPVGEFLSGWDAPLGCQLIDGYAVTHSKMTLTGQPVARLLQSTVLPTTVPSKIYYDGFVRKVVKTFPYPSPRVKNPYSPKNLATVVSLVRVLFGKPRVP